MNCVSLSCEVVSCLTLVSRLWANFLNHVIWGEKLLFHLRNWRLMNFGVHITYYLRSYSLNRSFVLFIINRSISAHDLSLSWRVCHNIIWNDISSWTSHRMGSATVSNHNLCEFCALMTVTWSLIVEFMRSYDLTSSLFLTDLNPLSFLAFHNLIIALHMLQRRVNVSILHWTSYVDSFLLLVICHALILLSVHLLLLCVVTPLPILSLLSDRARSSIRLFHLLAVWAAVELKTLHVKL